MTDRSDLAEAYENFFAALGGPLWQTRPAEAEATFQLQINRLRVLAPQLERRLWPPGLATLLWRPDDHAEPSRLHPANILPLPDIGDDG